MNMFKINVAGLKIDAITKKELLEEITKRIRTGQKIFVTTPYSEFLYYGLKDAKVMDMLNQANLAVPDGIGIFWAARYLSIPLTAKNYWLKILQAFWQTFYSLLAIIFYPRWIKTFNTPPHEEGMGEVLANALRKFTTTPSSPPSGGGEKLKWEKIAGADLIWDLAKLANDNYWSIYLLGGFGETPRLVANALKNKYPNIKIAGWSNKNPCDLTIIDDIKKANPDLLFVAYGPIKQEQWIVQNLPNLPVKLAIGLGGTFDYLAKKKANPPKFLRFIGLEWLWRLLTQPHRFKRIYNATFGLINLLVHYKIFMSYPIRKNALAVIINQEDKIFIARKSPNFHNIDIINNHDLKKWQNYWQFPQGGIEDSEDVTKAVKREVLEETGMDGLQFIKTSNQTHTYIWNNALRKFWRNRNYRFKGQSQSIVYLKFIGNENEIKLPPREELVDYKWVTVQDLNYAVHVERLPIVKIIQEDLKELTKKDIMIR
jgi:exopolysaccharide biosynthesis WecB/TagA/CpsF family protein